MSCAVKYKCLIVAREKKLQGQYCKPCSKYIHKSPRYGKLFIGPKAEVIYCDLICSPLSECITNH